MMYKFVRHIIFRARNKDSSGKLMDSFLSFEEHIKESVDLLQKINNINDWYATDDLGLLLDKFGYSLSRVINFYEVLHESLQYLLHIHLNDSEPYKVNFSELYKNLLFEDNKNFDVICFQRELEIFYGKLSSCRNSSFLKDFIFLERNFTSFYKKEKDLQMAINVLFSEKAKHSDFYDVPFLYNINYFLMRLRDFLSSCQISICSLRRYM
ncbi:hypothetical protein [Bombella saccharophila]|uniref:Uncharacterized protein n=1 Tax=Bombella saccharophila TaxID=2967338 RepID=A0ABT3W823_9PROT|nr:hypothetical protein [Bombella saccharophila]MCX5615230.1 hypothetical protein [Bombella saccharophila]